MASDDHISTSFGTVRQLSVLTTPTPPTPSESEHAREGAPSPMIPPLSPQPSSALTTPPDSPGSASSFPSLNSSVFFSSAPDDYSRVHSPAHSRAHSDAHGFAAGLIMPSLTLPPTLRRPTTYGQTLGAVRLLVLGRRGVGKTLLAGELVEGNEDIVEVAEREEEEGHSVLRASTYWIEQRDAHGLEHFEPARNVEIVEMDGYQHSDDPEQTLESTKAQIQTQFREVLDIIDPDTSSPLLAELLSSPSTPLQTALILLLSEAPSTFEEHLLTHLSPLIPIIPLPPFPSSPSPPNSSHSSFRPAHARALRNGLFRSPDTLTLLRSEATARFLATRSALRSPPARSRSPSPEHYASSSPVPLHATLRPTRALTHRRRSTKRASELPTIASTRAGIAGARRARSSKDTASTSAPQGHAEEWSKARWEAEWEETLARTAQAAAALNSDSDDSIHGKEYNEKSDDDKHEGVLGRWPPERTSVLRRMGSSLVFLPWALFGKIRNVFSRPGGGARTSSATVSAGQGGGGGKGRRRIVFAAGAALVGAFCAGIGIGFLMRDVKTGKM